MSPIRDRDSKFTATFDAVFAGADIRIIRTPVSLLCLDAERDSRGARLGPRPVRGG